MIPKRLNHPLVLRLAVPMILTNISTPLLGLVDTAVLGHLDSEQFLAAVALGGLIFSFVYWGFGFLRMGTTGLTAKAFGEMDQREVCSILIRALVLALTISVLILLFKNLLAFFSFWILQSSQRVEQLALHYFQIRIWSTPAALSTYVLMGWFLGRQNVRVPLLVMLTTNSINIGLDLLFVYYLNMKMEGVALASVIAEYVGFIIGFGIAMNVIRRQSFLLNWRYLVNIDKFKAMLSINTQILVRTWCLIFAFAFFTAQSAKFGDLILAANAVLVNFQTFMAYALDGFAHAVEALVGKALGAKNKVIYQQTLFTAGLWSLMIAILFAVSYLFFGKHVIDLLTGLNNVREMAYLYLPWLIVMPLASFVCYFFDGVFIGAILTKEMRNTMLFSLFVVFFPVWYLFQDRGNHGLWFAMTLFMLARGLSMVVVFIKKNKIICTTF